MPTWFAKFLCWIGWHDWEYLYSVKEDKIEYSTHECRRCLKRETVRSFDHTEW